MPSADGSAETPWCPCLPARAHQQRPFARSEFLRTWLGPSAPRWPQPPAKRSGSDAARRLLQIDAKPEHTHERSVSPPAVDLRRVAVGLGRPAGGERKPEPHSPVTPLWNEHAHGCAEARTNRRRAPLVAAGNAERRLENRRRHDPGQDRLTERRANVRTEGEIEVPSSRRRAEPKPEPSFAQRRTNAFFATAQRGPSTGPRDQ